MSLPLVSRYHRTPRHTTHYLESGPSDGPLLLFLHGWPAFCLLWRAHMDAFAADGWRCVAPDLRGYGQSSAPEPASAYSVEEAVTDMCRLHDSLGGQPAVWVSHDWGAVVLGALAAHEPQRCTHCVLMSVPYHPAGWALPNLVALSDRRLYPAEQFPDAQWDYFRRYQTHFDESVAALDADLSSTLASVFQPGDPASVGRVSPTALVSSRGGRFGPAQRAPPTEPDPALWPPADFEALVQAFGAHGFRPPCLWYLNDDANMDYASRAPNGGRLSQPVLFVNGAYDPICNVNGNRLAEPMRAACPNLTVADLAAGHWLSVEKKAETVQIIRDWLQSHKQ